jgi:hypothetical protein
MSNYLAQLKARRGERHLPSELPKLTKGSLDAEKQSPSQLPKVTKGAFVTFGSTQSGSVSKTERRDPADLDERTAILSVDGNIPEVYAAPFAELMRSIPAGVPEARWHWFVNDAGLLLDAWGQHAAALGWTPEDLFGLHLVAPLARYDHMGLCWLLKGNTVRLLNVDSATLSDGLIYRRTSRSQSNTPPPIRRIRITTMHCTGHIHPPTDGAHE